MLFRDQKYKYLLIILPFAVLVTVLFLVARGHTLQLLSPKGPIAHQERNLLLTAVSIMLAVAIPMFVVAGYIAWKYQEGNKASYTPNWDYHSGTQVAIWGIIVSVVFVLAILNWKTTHELDPYKAIASSVPPITIQVIALQWKWLFIYPQQNIATVNYVEFPSGTPVNFLLTSDAPMNSFWIPELGGQMYAMPGMSTQLHLEASAPGEFNGSAAEISGAGFAGMKFQAVASTPANFNNWVAQVKRTAAPLTMGQYNQLDQPSAYNPAAFYSTVAAYLYDRVTMKYMAPNGGVQ